jgi:N-acetylglucosamine-6-phosphate deacetylase
VIISAPRLLTGGRITGPGAVIIKAGIIKAVLDYLPDQRADHFAFTSGILTPGLIDIHNNGAFGVDVAVAGPDEWAVLTARLAACGVTSFLPTIITAPLAALHAAARQLRAAQRAAIGGPVTQIIGLHLEGPFLSPARRGAHNPNWLIEPDKQALDALLANDDLRAALRLVTLAPELPGGLPAIRRFVGAGIAVALGHSDAAAAMAIEAADAGARLATHVFTAMRAFHHRDPGIAAVVLTDPRLAPCFITDGVHADPVTLRMGFAAAGNRAIAVTDSVLLAGMTEKDIRDFGGAPAHLLNGAARRLDGTLTGAAITLDEGVRRLISYGITPKAALAAATKAPAQALGLADRGDIVPGLRADLVWFDDEFRVREVWIGGTAINGHNEPPHATATLPLTEMVRPGLDDLDSWDEAAIITALLAQEARAQAALGRAISVLARLAAAIAARIEAGGRLFYAGAGTSGRLAVLDAVECGPTFSLPDGVIIPLLAGGETAMRHAVEGAEDNEDAAAAALQRHAFSSRDTLIGIAASGRTPFVLGALKAARAAGALTGAIVNSPGSPVAGAADIAIEIVGGGEILAGSTRLSAGTTQKIALNALSTTVMIRLGKTYGPLMVDLRATNAKLHDRARRIVMSAAHCTQNEAAAALDAANGMVKPAILIATCKISANEAMQRLNAAGGHLRAALTAD